MSEEYRSGVLKGYEDCAIFLDGIAVIYTEHTMTGKALKDAAKHLRLLKNVIAESEGDDE